jgi:hypothetical protein
MELSPQLCKYKPQTNGCVCGVRPPCFEKTSLSFVLKIIHVFFSTCIYMLKYVACKTYLLLLVKGFTYNFRVEFFV